MILKSSGVNGLEGMAGPNPSHSNFFHLFFKIFISSLMIKGYSATPGRGVLIRGTLFIPDFANLSLINSAKLFENTLCSTYLCVPTDLVGVPRKSLENNSCSRKKIGSYHFGRKSKKLFGKYPLAATYESINE